MAESERAEKLPTEVNLKPKIKHDWYQTDANVVVTILLRNAEKDKVKVSYGPRSLSLSSAIPADPSSEYSLELELAHFIVPEECGHTVTPSKIEVRLRKAQGLRWTVLEGEAESGDQTEDQIKAIPQAVIDASGPPAAATALPNSCPFRKDWNQIENEMKKQEEEEKPEGDAAINDLFQKIYGEGSDEVRKAMNKSFMESGGTVLSTNWNEVAKDKVDIKPPSGMEWKKWDS